MRRIITGAALLILSGCVFGSQPNQDKPGMMVPSPTATAYPSPRETNGPETILPSTSPTFHPSLSETEPPATPTALPGNMQNQCLEMTSANMSEILSSKGLVLFDRKGGKA